MDEHRAHSRFRAAIALVALFILLPWTALAQDATPQTTGEAFRSPTRDEFTADYLREMAFSEPANPGGAFIDSNLGDIQTIQPLFAEDAYTVKVVGLIYDQLVGSDPRTGQPAPTGLADSWEVAPDGKTYTFHLNKDAKWHDGADVTAADVQFSLDALANPDVGSAYSQSFLDSTESWRVIDDDTFEVVAKEPLYTFLYDLVAWIIPKHVWENVPVTDWHTDGGATGQDPSRVVGSGPFRFREWKPGERLTLDRNDAYYGHVPYLDSYTLVIWPDQTALVNALLSNQVDAAALEPADVETVAAMSGLKVATYPTADFVFYLTNLDPEKSPYFQDKRVREALLYALDRQSIVTNILLGQAEVAEGTQPVVSYAYAPDLIATHYDYDPAKAKALLAEAGWTDSDGDGTVDKDGRPLAFEVIYPSGSPTYDQELAYVQDAWKAIGVAMTPRSLEFPALINAMTVDHAFDIALLGFSWDASFIQDAMFGCAQYEGGFNVVKYCNPTLDEINAKAKRTFEETARKELIVEATNLINEDLPVTVLYFNDASVGYSDRLQNFHPNTWGADLSYVWISEG